MDKHLSRLGDIAASPLHGGWLASPVLRKLARGVEERILPHEGASYLGGAVHALGGAELGLELDTDGAQQIHRKYAARADHHEVVGNIFGRPVTAQRNALGMDRCDFTAQSQGKRLLGDGRFETLAVLALDPIEGVAAITERHAGTGGGAGKRCFDGAVTAADHQHVAPAILFGIEQPIHHLFGSSEIRVGYAT